MSIREHHAPSVRLPLQLGTSAVAFLARGGALFVPAAILSAGAAVVFYALSDLGKVGAAVATAIGLPVLALLAFAGNAILLAWRARPSDIVIDAGGIAIRGGPCNGLERTWGALAQPPCRFAPAVAATKDPQQELHRVILCEAAGEIELAVTDNLDEAASLQDVVQTICGARAKAEDASLPPPPPRESVARDILRCETCAAPQAPADESSVRCAYCGNSVDVPAELRERVRAGNAIAARPDEAVAALLRQPDARKVSGVFGVAAVFVLAAWPIALVIFALNVRERATSVTTTLLLVAFVLTSIAGFYAFARARLVDRIALRLVVLDFAATAPQKEASPYRCRNCSAPLPHERKNAVVAHCVYCNTNNVLGLHLHREANEARAQTESLETAVGRRDRERARLRGAGVASLVLLGVSGAFLRSGFARNPITAPLEVQCAAAELTPCVELARLLGPRRVKEVRGNPSRSVELFDRACDAGRGDACNELADFLSDRLLGAYDGKRSNVARRSACDHGVAQACYVLAEKYEKGEFLVGLKKDHAMANEFYARACAGGIARACGSR